MRTVLSLGLMAALGACVALGTGGVQSLAVAGGAVTVQGPEGYCVDTRVSRPSRGFAALASCALISDIAVVPGIEGLITVQVGSAGSAIVEGAEQDLARILRSETGAALLASDGAPSSVVMDRVETSAGLVIVHFTDRAPPAIDGLEQLEWRAFLDINGRLVTIGVRGFQRAPLTPAEGLRLLNRAAYSLRLANSLDTMPETQG